MRNFEKLYQDGSGARRPSDEVQARVLAANVPEFITVPTGATHVIFASTLDFYAKYYSDALDDSVVSNGAFASDTLWTKGTGWTIAAGVASSDGTQAGNSDLEQVLANLADPLVEGAQYYVTFTVSNFSAGNVRPVVGGTAGTNRAANGTFSELIIAGSGTSVLMRADLDFVGSVDNLSVTPAVSVPAADDTTGEVGELVKAEVPEESRARIVSGVQTIAVVAPATTVLTASFYQT